MKKLTALDITLTGVFAAVLCVLAPMSIPLPGLVPLSLATLILYFAAYILGPVRAVLCCITYLLIGLAGIPVFSGWSAGISKLAGPTGGFLVGYVFLTYISAWGVKRFSGSRPLEALSLALGTLILYIIGSLWLSWVTKISFGAALASGALPFIPGDAIKITAAVFLAPVVKKRVGK